MIFGKKNTFRGGVHPAETYGGKAVTGAMPVVDMPVSAQVAIALSQHVGAPCKPLVKPGDRVLVGQKIGEPAAFMGAPVHSSVSGTVKALAQRVAANGMPVQVVLIDNDGQDEWAELHPVEGDPMQAENAQLLSAIREAGVVGLGGATFPTQIKLSPPETSPIDTVILNGAECEPYLTGDHRAMLEKSDEIVDGLRIAMKILSAKRGVIAIEANKPDAIAAMQAAASGKGVEVMELQVKYPQGGEKQLIQVVTGRQVPSGSLPMAAGCVVMNVSSAAAVSVAVRTGRPIIDRVVTVTGLVAKPANLRVRIGERIGTLIEACGGPVGDAGKLVLGGPMMGMAAYDYDTPVVKGTSGVLLLPADEKAGAPVGNCIRCGTCVTNCPIHLMPLNLYALSKRSLFERAKEEHAMDCIECGCCSYGCPAKLPLVQSIRVAKREIAKKR